MRSERTSFGKYQVLARLGQGGMGHVYLAVHAGPAGVEKLIVVKQLREDLAESVASRSMFLDEARIATRLNHPNIVQTIEVVDEADLYIVMDFVDGQPLSRILDGAHFKFFSVEARLRILIATLEGLHYAHELKDYDGRPLGVVHRDVSPQNIIVTYDGHVKLVDFGVAKAADATTVTASGVFKGKVRYAAPEQALCADVDRRADVFAVGTILWEMLCGKRMWQEQGDASVLLSLAQGIIPRLKDARPDVPPELEAICTKALSHDASSRYATALEFRDALAGYLRQSGEKETNLGATVATAFAEERRGLHTLIDAQIKALREQSSGAMTVRKIPTLGNDSAGSLVSVVSEKSLARTGLAMTPASRRASQLPPPRTSSSWIALAALGGVLAVVGGIALLAPSRHDASAGTTAAPTVHVSLRASPPSARLVLDGKPLEANPFVAELPRDEGEHHLTIQADGFETRDISASFARDVNVDVALAHSGSTASVAPAPQPPLTRVESLPVAQPVRAGVRPPPAPPPPAANATSHPTKTGPQRKIDEEDPYAQ